MKEAMNLTNLMNLSQTELVKVREYTKFDDRETYNLTWLVGRKNFGWICGALHEYDHSNRDDCTGCQAADKKIAQLGL